jgi:hypothetical protein
LSLLTFAAYKALLEKIEKLNYKGNMWVRARADANTPTGLYVKSIQQSSNSSESNNMSYGNRGSNRYGGGGRRGGYGGGSGGGDRFGNRSMGGPKPVEVGKEYDVDITELSRRGDGVAKIQGFIIFVRGRATLHPRR